MGGRKIERPYEHPQIRTGAAVIALTYELAARSESQELMTATSHLSGKRINRFTHIHQSPDDLLKKVQMTRECCHHALCIQRCMGADALNALSIVTHQIDQVAGTKYYRRFNEFLEYVQDNDLTGNAAMTDVKGDRSLRPHQQADADMYLHVVERTDKGIVVRGAKAHNTNAPYAHELIVLPTREMTEADKDYAVAFAVPADTEGIHLRRCSRPTDACGERPMTVSDADAPLPSRRRRATVSAWPTQGQRGYHGGRVSWPLLAAGGTQGEQCGDCHAIFIDIMWKKRIMGLYPAAGVRLW
jgi:aromatic ring hydroxylase